MKILVIDDEHSFGNLLGHALRRLGHRAVVAVHPEDALGMLDDEVDAIITDIDMPVMNGVELVYAIRERMPEMPVAFCTGSAPESETVHEAQRLGRVLPKIWTVAEVEEVVADLERSRSFVEKARRRRRLARGSRDPPVEKILADQTPIRQQIDGLAAHLAAVPEPDDD